MSRTLADFGERFLTMQILSKYVDGAFGNDCAEIDIGDTTLVVTTDPVPKAAAGLLGGDLDLYWMGWLLVTINASDLAAAGASPLGFLAALDLEATMPIGELERLLDGVRDSCHVQGLSYLGGNVREANALSAVGTAIGQCKKGLQLRRRGAKDGDLLAIVGKAGAFWNDVERVKRGSTFDKTASPLFRPISQIAVMKKLAEARLISAAMDNSDGLLPSISQLAHSSGIGCNLDMGQLDLAVAALPESSGLNFLNPGRLCLGWGDWNVVCAIDPANRRAAQEIIALEGGTITICGEFTSEHDESRIRLNGKLTKAARLESERFATDSWFHKGIEFYRQMMIDLPLE